MRRWIVLALMAAAASARADGALDELSAGASQQTPTNPRASWVADKLGGIWDASELWQVRLDVTGTRESGAKPAAGSTFGASGGTIFLVNASTEYDPDDHWSYKLAAGFSPRSSSSTSTSVQAQGLGGNTTAADARLKSTTQTVSGAAWVGYDTAGGGDFETSGLVTATVNVFDTQQQITAVQDKTGKVLNLQQIKDFCATHPCSSQLQASLTGQSAQLAQFVLDASVSEQLHGHTDVGLEAAYYLYNTDPTQVGYFSVTSVGRTSTFGGGVGIAPLLVTAMPSAIYRWGTGWTALVSFTYGKYVSDQGYNLTAAFRLQYKWKLEGSRRLKLYAKLVGARDADQTNNISKSGILAFGAQFTW